jgi:hypothetical protein
MENGKSENHANMQSKQTEKGKQESAKEKEGLLAQVRNRFSRSLGTQPVTKRKKTEKQTNSTDKHPDEQGRDQDKSAHSEE